VLFYAVPDSRWKVGFLDQDPLLLGCVAGLLFWVGSAWLLLSSTRPDRANASSYDEFMQRLDRVRAQITAIDQDGCLESSETLAEAESYCGSIDAALARSGSRWSSGNGYVEIWRQLHRAEEALIEAGTDSDAFGAALFDEPRLLGSTMGDSEMLLRKLRLAVEELSPSGSVYLDPPDGKERPNGLASLVDVRQIAALPKRSSRMVNGRARKHEARVAIRQVRRAINDFRDDKWNEIIRTRNRVSGTLTLTSLLLFLLLAVALAGVSSRDTVAGRLADPIIAATVLFLIGAVTGLFDRLYRDSGTRVPTLDTDLGRARSILTVVLSGLAAVGGVVILTLSASMVSGDVLTPSTQRDLVTVASPNDSLGLDDIYNLKAYPFGMVLAAALGLTPGLVINRLKKITDEQTLDLEKSGAQGVTTSNA
jgi:hypothetical protein